jgi:hypothetical protein
MKHSIYDNEIKIIKDASDALFSPQPGGMDAQSAYQQIHHMLEEVKGRCW